jgi:hypothetical protein
VKGFFEQLNAEMWTEALTIAARVATPLGLIGIAIVAVLYGYCRYLMYQERKLQSLPEEERAKSVDTWLRRLGLEIANLTRAQKFTLVQDELEKRHQRSIARIRVAAGVIVGCFGLAVFGYVVAVTRSGPKNESPYDDTPPEVIIQTVAPPKEIKGRQSIPPGHTGPIPAENIGPLPTAKDKQE